MIIQSRRILLRPMEEGDLERVRTWINREDISVPMGIGTPVSVRDQESWYKALQESKDKMVFAVLRKEDGLHIGNISIDQISQRDSNARLTLFIGEENLRGLGYGREAAAAMLGFCFEELGYNKVYLIVNEKNRRAIRAYEGCGFKQEGFLREQQFLGGEYVNKIFMGILRREFEKK